ncbi:MAG: hypothetical protein ACU0BN_07610 [Sulfitobacter sp.]
MKRVHEPHSVLKHSDLLFLIIAINQACRKLHESMQSRSIALLFHTPHPIRPQIAKVQAATDKRFDFTDSPPFAALVFSLAISFHLREINRFQRFLTNRALLSVTFFHEQQIGRITPF